MKSYKFVKEMSADLYCEFMSECFQAASEFRVIMRSNENMTTEIEKFMNATQNSLIARCRVTSWPVTTLINDNYAIEFRYKADDKMRNAISEFTKRQFDWRYPTLPSDCYFIDEAQICFYSLWSSGDYALIDEGYVSDKLFAYLINDNYIVPEQ
jgi:hypothetical protein